MSDDAGPNYYDTCVGCGDDVSKGSLKRTEHPAYGVFCSKECKHAYLNQFRTV